MKTKIFIILLGIILYSLTLRGVPGNPTVDNIFDNFTKQGKIFENGSELGRYIEVIGLNDNHSYALTRQMVDKGSDFAYFGGRYFVLFAPGVSYLALPFYQIGLHFNLAQLFTFGFVSLVSIFCLLLIYKICREIFLLPGWASLIAVIIFGFGCTSWSYAITLYQHIFTTFCIISSFYAVWRYKKSGWMGFIWASIVWINYGIAIFLDYPNALLMLPVMLYLLFASFNFSKVENRYRLSMKTSVIFASVFFGLIMVMHGYHNQVYFGSWSKISSGIPSLKSVRELGILDAPNIDELLKAAPQKDIGKFIQERNVVSSLNTLLFASDKGLFFFSPIFLLSVLAIYQLRRKLEMEHWVLLGIVFATLFLYSGWGDPWGGWAYGPRYLIPMMPSLAILIGIWINNNSKLFPKLILSVLFAFSSAVALLGPITTNAIRPAIEDNGLHVKHNFMFNVDFIHKNISPSYVYNVYFSS